MPISGGSDRVRYFASLGVFTQKGLFETFHENDRLIAEHRNCGGGKGFGAGADGIQSIGIGRNLAFHILIACMNGFIERKSRYWKELFTENLRKMFWRGAEIPEVVLYL